MFGMNALDHLLEQTRRLPGPGPSPDLPRALDWDAPAGVASLPSPELRRGVAALLHALAARVGAELAHAQELARRAWDQVDSITLVDADTWDEARRLRAAARAGSADDEAAVRSEAVAAALTIDAAVGLALLVERRLAALLRLSEAEGHSALLDLGAALAETARTWA
jgi:hypothetical protein